MKNKLNITVLILIATAVITGITCCSCSKDEVPAFIPGSSIKPDDGDNIPNTGKADFSKLTADNHPRLILNEEEFAALKDKVGSVDENSPVGKLHGAVMKLAESKVSIATNLVYEKDAAGKRILGVSQEALARIFSCAYAYRFTGDEKYLKHAEHDIATVCNFKDWNVKGHTLDAAEMSAAVALGYDWLYNSLSNETKALATAKLAEYGMQPVLNGQHSLNFYNAANNWNQVCNGGFVCAALATYEANREISDKTISKAVNSNRTAMEKMYSPDGNYPEGPGYWSYGNIYQVFMLTCLESTLGWDYDLSAIQGFNKTGDYIMFCYGATGRFFNYSDNMAKATPAMALWYFADKFRKPSLIYHELDFIDDNTYISTPEARLMPLLLRYAYNLEEGNISHPTEKIFSGNGDNPVVLIHTDWTMSNTDKFLGIKAGAANVNHGHADAGSFVFDAEGVRWASDFDRESYATLENALYSIGGNLWDMSQTSRRWDIFRYNNRQHNTLTLNDKNHTVAGKATIKEIISSSSESGAVLDMSPVFASEAESVERTIKLVNNQDIVIIDKVKATSGKVVSIRWTMVTEATKTEVNPTLGISLRHAAKERQLKCTVSGATGLRFMEWSSDPNDAANPPATTSIPNQVQDKSKRIIGFTASIPAGKEATFTTMLRKTN